MHADRSGAHNKGWVARPPACVYISLGTSRPQPADVPWDDSSCSRVLTVKAELLSKPEVCATATEMSRNVEEMWGYKGMPLQENKLRPKERRWRCAGGVIRNNGRSLTGSSSRMTPGLVTSSTARAVFFSSPLEMPEPISLSAHV